LVNSTDHRDPGVNRRRLGLLHHYTAFPLVRVRTLNDVRCCLNGSFAFFPAQEKELADMAEEAAISRLYGGIHFRSDNEVGLTLGRRVGQVPVQAYHVPSP
jgi:hypothetical protein